MLRFVTALLLACAPGGAWSQPMESPEGPPLTLERALELALSNGFAVRDAALLVEMTSDKVSAAKTRRLPFLQATASETRHLTNEEFTFDEGAFGDYPVIGAIPASDTSIGTQERWGTVVGVRAALPLSQQYEIGLGIRQEKLVQGLAEEDLRAARQRVSDETKQTYYRIVEIQATIRAIEESLAFLSALDQLVDRYVHEQVALEYESLEVKTRLAETRQQRLERENQLSTEKENLNRLMGRPLATPFRIEAPLAASEMDVDPEEARETALSQRPDVRAAQLGIERAETGYRLGVADFIPEINLVASYLRPFDVELIPDEYAVVAFEAEWEFFTWGRRLHELGAHRAEILKARNEMRSVEARVGLEVNHRIRVLQESLGQIPVAELAERAAREKLRVMMSRYRERAALLQHVLEAESELAEATAGYHIAQLQVLIAQADLDRALGEE